MDKLDVKLFIPYTKCGLGCSYCYVKNKTIDISKRGEKRLRKFRNALGKQSYMLSIALQQNGEILISDPMMQFVADLSRLDNVEAVNFNTSLYPSRKILSDFLSKVNTKTLTLTCSYHQYVYTNYEDFKEKLRMITNAGVSAVVLMVAYPKNLRKLEFFKREFDEMGVPLSINSFSGEYEGREYPSAYTEDEREFLKGIFFSEAAYEYNLLRKKTKGISCQAGVTSISISPKGDVYACRSDWAKPKQPFLKIAHGWLSRKSHRFNPFYKGVHLGNLFTGFRLLKSHRCPHKICKCAKDFINTSEFISEYKKSKNLRIYTEKKPSAPDSP